MKDRENTGATEKLFYLTAPSTCDAPSRCPIVYFCDSVSSPNYNHVDRNA